LKARRSKVVGVAKDVWLSMIFGFVAESECGALVYLIKVNWGQGRERSRLLNFNSIEREK
jgi:hypothetical protein